MPLKVFLSYSRADRSAVEQVYDTLQAAGHAPWMDVKNIHVGQAWEAEIAKALRDCDVVFVFLSSHSVSKRGYFQKEITTALQYVETRLEDDIYIVPIRLEDIQVPQRLSKWQWVDLFVRDEALQKLLSALNEQERRLSVHQTQIRSDEYPEISYELERLKEEAQGSYGYSFEIDLINFHWKQNAPAAQQITDVLRGAFVSRAMSERSGLLYRSGSVEPPPVQLGEGSYYIANPSIKIFGEGLVTVGYSIQHYGGGAHPNYDFETFNFLLSPLVLLSIHHVFSDTRRGLGLVSSKVVEDVGRQMKEMSPDVDRPDIEWLENGAAPKPDNYLRFMFDETGLILLFPPYQLAAYAFGPFQSKVSYREIWSELSPAVRDALQSGRISL